MRFIRKCIMAAGSLLVFLGSAQAQSIKIGSDAVWAGGNDFQKGNRLSAQIANLPQAAIIQSLTFDVTVPSGNLILGIYDASGPGGGPGALKASTASFTPITGWNTANVAKPCRWPPATTGWPFCQAATVADPDPAPAGNCKYYSYSFAQPAEHIQRLASELHPRSLVVLRHVDGRPDRRRRKMRPNERAFHQRRSERLSAPAALRGRLRIPPWGAAVHGFGHATERMAAPTPHARLPLKRPCRSPAAQRQTGARLECFPSAAFRTGPRFARR